MKTHFLKRCIFLLAALSVANVGHAENSASSVGGKAYHVVVIWLKQHGDAGARQKYIEASKGLAKLPGVLSYNIGTPVAIHREKPSHAVDESYDIAISSSFENRQALENYLKHPEHLKVIHEVLKPMVEKYKVYDFGE